MGSNKEFLEQAIDECLTKITDYEVSSEIHQKAYKEAMNMLDYSIALEKVEEKKRELTLREKEMELKEKELTFKEKSEKNNKVLKYIEIIAVPASLLALEYVFKYHFMKTVCNFEKDYTFTTTPGRSIASLFKWRK